MIVIPCNTSCFFHEKLQNEINIPINNMIKDTVNYLKEKNIKKVAVLATTGTIKAGLYQKELVSNNIAYTLPNQNKVMNIIYNYVKAGKKIHKNIWDDLINDISKDVEAYILGCTELSVIKKDLKLNKNFVDPLEIETEIILNYFDKERID